ncbi:MAG: DUF2804 domain-containing protein [Hungatella sp.]|jgi:hypothetical protein|nr:DUF2804 domain-containing protein [Hungatella sp.]
MQQKLKQGVKLLREDGTLAQAGYSNEFIVEYNRENIRRSQSDVREWDYHLALEEAYALGISVASVGNGSRVSLHFMDFEEGQDICETDFVPSPIPVPRDPFGDVSFRSSRSEGTYIRKGNTTFIRLSMKDFGGVKGRNISGLLQFTVPKTDKMVLVVPYEDDPELFYYNYKVNCMSVVGFVEIGERIFRFTEDNCSGTNDWGRGIWKPVNQWYWASASGRLGGELFGFNVGHGFGDTSRATENMIFYGGVCHKLEEVTFHIPGDRIGDLKLILPDENYLKPWTFVSGDGRLDMEFIPLYDRQSGVQGEEYFSMQHQVFGHFNGKAVLDDGTVLEFHDFLGFAEKVGNDWRR